MRKRPLYASALVLVATASVHATGYPAAAQAAVGGDLEPLFERGLGILWVDFSVFLVVLAMLLVYAARRARPLPGLVKIVACATLLQAVVTAAVAGIRFPFVWVIVLAALLPLASLIPIRDDAGGVSPRAGA